MVGGTAIRNFLAGVALAMFATAPRADCRQALALGLDVSGSVDSAEYRLQLDGLAGALSHPEVKEALLAMPAVPVNLLIYEWSGPDFQRLLLDWTAITNATQLENITTRLRQTRRADADVTTALGAALRYGLAQLNQRPDCWKRTLDISGDGKSNTGPHPETISRLALVDQITVNGLVIGAPPRFFGDTDTVQIGELSAYYHAYVLAGPDAFVETALGFEDFEVAMVRKLKRELMGLSLSALPQRPVQLR